MRTRSRLLLSFLTIHLILSALVGWVAWALVDGWMRDQARDSARAIGGVMTRGGFTLTDDVLSRMQELTGYRFRFLTGPGDVLDGTIQVTHGGRIIEVDYQTDQYEDASRTVIAATLLLFLAGMLIFGVAALVLSGQFARPVESLAASARLIGEGNLERAVPAVGSGEIADLAADLDTMRKRIHELDRQHRQDERLATVGTFTAVIAHEVRNPLSAVQLTVQMLAQRLGNDPGLAMIMQELERLDLIIDQLLAYSKGMSVTPQSCDLRALVDNVVGLLRRQSDHAGVTVAVNGAAIVLADPARIRQLVMNLVINAVQAQHGAGSVTIDLRPDGLAVSDHGPGVAPALVPNLFDPFATNKPGGTGLGLHLSWTIAQAHGATLRYEKLPIGCRFVLEGLRS
jgi:signal transduction histidine kinase